MRAAEPGLVNEPVRSIPSLLPPFPLPPYLPSPPSTAPSLPSALSPLPSVLSAPSPPGLRPSKSPTPSSSSSPPPRGDDPPPCTPAPTELAPDDSE